MAFPTPSPSQTRASVTAKRILYLLVACILVYLMWSYSAGEHTPHNFASTESPPLTEDLDTPPVAEAQHPSSDFSENVEASGATTTAGQEGEEKDKDVIVQEVQTEVVVETAHAAV